MENKLTEWWKRMDEASKERMLRREANKAVGRHTIVDGHLMLIAGPRIDGVKQEPPSQLTAFLEMLDAVGRSSGVKSRVSFSAGVTKVEVADSEGDGFGTWVFSHPEERLMEVYR